MKAKTIGVRFENGDASKVFKEADRRGMTASSFLRFLAREELRRVKGRKSAQDQQDSSPAVQS